MSIINRIKEKVLLWVRFFQLAENFWSIWIQRGFAMFGLARVFNLDSTIRLKNGIRLAQDKVVDVSAVPVVVEIWGTQPYTEQGFAIEPHDTVFDIGANVGSFAVYASTKTDGPIYCFEPVPDNMRLIKQSIALNGIQTITPVNAAVASQEKDLQIHLSYSNAMHSTLVRPDASGQSITVPVINIENFCRDHNITRIDYLKIDCEGAEYDIVLNWSDQFPSSVQRLVLEYHDHPTRTYQDLVVFLNSHGFQTTEYGGHYIFANGV